MITAAHGPPFAFLIISAASHHAQGKTDRATGVARQKLSDRHGIIAEVAMVNCTIICFSFADSALALGQRSSLAIGGGRAQCLIVPSSDCLS